MTKIIKSVLSLAFLIIVSKANAQKYTCDEVGLITTSNYSGFIGKTIYILPDTTFKNGTNRRLEELSRNQVYPGGGFPAFYTDASVNSRAYKGNGNEKNSNGSGDKTYSYCKYKVQMNGFRPTKSLVSKVNEASDYDALAGKHFKITDIQFKPPYQQLFLQLTDEDGKDVFYHALDVSGDKITNADLFVFDDCRNAKNKNEGKTFIAQVDYSGSSAPVYENGQHIRYVVNDVNTGRPVPVKMGSEWKCDKVIEQSNYILSNGGNTINVVWLPNDAKSHWTIRFDNKRGDSAVLLMGAFEEKETYFAKKKSDSLAVIADQEAIKAQAAQREQDKIDAEKNSQYRLDTLVKRYGTKNGTMIHDKQVAIGFTEQMCIDAWGYPPAGGITTTIVADIKGEQWVYSLDPPRILYFDNGVLTTVQQ